MAIKKIVLNRYNSIRNSEKNDKWIVLFILGISLFVYLDIFSLGFSWMAFQERDFSRACDFILGKGLSHLGPEMTRGGYLPGPCLTLLFSIPAWIFKSPRGIHILLQLSFVVSTGLVFMLAKRHLNRTIAYLSLAFCLSAPAYIMYSFAGWHVSLVVVINILIVYLYDKYIRDKKKIYLFLIGLLIGCGIQIHMLVLSIALLYFLYLLCFHRKNLVNIISFSILGIIITFIYYFFFDYLNGFSNTSSLLNQTKMIGGGIWGNRLNIWRGYGNYVFYGIGDQWLIKFDTGWLSLVAILVGLTIAFSNRYENRMKYIRIIIFLMFLIILPWFCVRSAHPRYYLPAHPAFEVLLAISAYLIYKKFQHIKFIQRFFTTAILSIFVINSSMIFTRTIGSKTNIRLPLAAFISKYATSLPPSTREALTHKLRKAEDFIAGVRTIKYMPYAKMKKLTEFLLSELALSPQLYSDRFYFFRGNELSPFNVEYLLPSDSHYTLIYNKTYKNDNARKNNNLNFEGDYGIVLIANKDIEVFNSKKIDVFKVSKTDDFTVYYYRGPYFYRQSHQYCDLSKAEKELQEKDVNEIIREKKADSLFTSAVINIQGKSKDFRYLHEIKIREDEKDILSGYTQIISSDLRQSAYVEQSPYFIKDPTVKVIFSNGEKYSISVMEEHFYLNVTNTNKEKLYEKYGNIGGTHFLGNGYVEAPYGVSFTIHKKQISDIRAIIFLNRGYSTITMDENVDTEISKKVEL